MFSNTFCPLPWIHLATRPNGDVRLCCTSNASGAGIIDVKDIGLVKSDTVNMNLRDHTIEEVWNSEFMKRTRLQMLSGEVPDSCRKCFNEEDCGIQSKRKWETRGWNERLDLRSIVSQTQADGSLPVHIPYFDLRLGNVCNLKCVMCSPHDSSSWIKEWRLNQPNYKNVNLKQDQTWDDSFDYTWYKKGSFLESMKTQAQNIRELYFAGGEPLMIPEHFNILEFMIENGFAKDCIIRYNSNGTKITDKLLELWTHFKQVKFNFSIDDVGERNEYIRYPSTWNEVEENLKILDNTPDNVIVNIACAVQMLNIGNIDQLARWKHSMQFKKINAMPYGAGLIGLHLVYLPSYLNVKVLPQNIKQAITTKLTNFINTFDSDDFRNDLYGSVRWEGLINYMNSEDWSHKLPMAIEYLETNDITRGTDFRRTFIELENL